MPPDGNLHAGKGTPPVQRVGISVQKTGKVVSRSPNPQLVLGRDRIEHNHPCFTVSQIVNQIDKPKG